MRLSSDAGCAVNHPSSLYLLAVNVCGSCGKVSMREIDSVNTTASTDRVRTLRRVGPTDPACQLSQYVLACVSVLPVLTFTYSARVMAICLLTAACQDPQRGAQA